MLSSAYSEQHGQDSTDLRNGRADITSSYGVCMGGASRHSLDTPRTLWHAGGRSHKRDYVSLRVLTRTGHLYLRYYLCEAANAVRRSAPRDSADHRITSVRYSRLLDWSWSRMLAWLARNGGRVLEEMAT
jgi:hypothetical protein